MSIAVGRARSPCQGCRERRVGCHSAESCGKWRDYTERKEAEYAAFLTNTENARMMSQYKAESIRRFEMKKEGKHKC